MTRTLFAILFLLVGAAPGYPDGAKHSSVVNVCPRDADIAEFSRVAHRNGNVDTVHVPGGIEIIATSGTAEGIKAIQEAASVYLSHRENAKNENLEAAGADPCVATSQAIAAGQAT